MDGKINPVTVGRAMSDAWPRSNGVLMGAAMLWADHMPKYRGWGPRMLGRTLGRKMRATMRTASGGTVAIEPACLDIYTACVTRGGMWEPLIHDVCKAMTRPGDVFFDIGANAGVLCVDVASHFKGAVRVAAFEPLPSLASRIALSARLSGLEEVLSVFDVMLGERSGEASLYLPTHWTLASAVPREGRTTELKRRVVTMDELVGSGAAAAPDTIKMDVEGGELGVLRGAREVLRTKRPTLVFEADANMRRFGHTRKDLLDVLSSCAPYRYFYVGGKGLEPVTNLDAPYDDDHSNIMAIAPEREVPRFR